ncbi:MAG: dUTP diphosphatase [Bacteroidetes bacterium]|jgi:dUTP pyrophosphatase|nr:dUTP diphosphatase [Bacteroidota bacterium]
MELKVKVINKGTNPLPAYQTLHAAGLDVMANLEETIIIEPMARKLVSTGLFVEIPPGFEIQIRPRSGLALKHGITVLNSPGTIDADYRGEVKVLLINLGAESFLVQPGERIAQMVLAKHEVLSWELVEKLTESDRGSGGYGSTGK